MYGMKADYNAKAGIFRWDSFRMRALIWVHIVFWLGLTISIAIDPHVAINQSALPGVFLWACVGFIVAGWSLVVRQRDGKQLSIILNASWACISVIAVGGLAAAVVVLWFDKHASQMLRG